MHASTHRVDRYEVGNVEVGGPSASEDGFPQGVDLGAEGAVAVRRVIEAARDARQPPPRMRAVPVEDPEEEDAVSAWFADVAVGVGEAIGAEDPFPITTRLLTRFGAGQERPRYVRVDTEDSYRAFCCENSPEMAEMRDRLAALADRVEGHVRDPYAHEDLVDAIDEVELLGAEVQAAERSKAIDLWLPEWARGWVRAWREGDHICASVCLPGADGDLRICTSMTPVVRAFEEIERYAASADVSAAAIVGVLPAMGCVLGAGTLVKEIAAAAPSILQRTEAAGRAPFVCRIEPKACPSLCALVALLCECARGDKQACAEWDALASAAEKGGAGPAARAMRDARALFARGTVVGAVMSKSAAKISPVAAGGGCRCPQCGAILRVGVVRGSHLTVSLVGADEAASEASSAAEMERVQRAQEILRSPSGGGATCTCPNCGAVLRIVLASAPGAAQPKAVPDVRAKRW